MKMQDFFSQALRSFRVVIASAVLLLISASPALALSLDEAKARGLVGEKRNGYLGVVESAPGVQQLVREINGKRRSRYQQIASKNKTSVGKVEILSGQKAIKKTAPGLFVESKSGRWRKK